MGEENREVENTGPVRQAASHSQLQIMRAEVAHGSGGILAGVRGARIGISFT